VKALLFKHKLHHSKAYLNALLAILLLCILTINIHNPYAYAESAKACLFITPPMYLAKEVGELFDIAVNISDVENLRSLEFTVAYNASLLYVKAVIQGPFFPPPPRSHFTFEENESIGSIRVNMSIGESEAPRSGEGTLAYVGFEVIQGPLSCVSSPLDLGQTLLLDSELIEIPHDSVGAVFFWKSMQPDPPVNGRSIDVCTQKAGVGPGEPGGEFLAGEVVQLTSLVTYNDNPVQRKLVSFEVLDPLNQSVVIRTILTDQNGLAEISFRIPDILDSIGTWTVISVVEIAEKTAWDTLVFQVYAMGPVGGYTVRIKEYTTANPSTTYAAIILLIAVFIVIGNITHRKHHTTRKQKID